MFGSIGQQQLGRSRWWCLPSQDHCTRHQRRRRSGHFDFVCQSHRNYHFDPTTTTNRHSNIHQHGSRTITDTPKHSRCLSRPSQSNQLPTIPDPIHLATHRRESTYRIDRFVGNGYRTQRIVGGTQPIVVNVVVVKENRRHRRRRNSSGNVGALPTLARTILHGVFETLRRTGQAIDGLAIALSTPSLYHRVDACC